MRRIGAQIVEEKKRDAAAASPIRPKDAAFSGVEASQMVGRDMLSVLGELVIIWLANHF
jgi:hypothetical protein